MSIVTRRKLAVAQKRISVLGRLTQKIVAQHVQVFLFTLWIRVLKAISRYSKLPLVLLLFLSKKILSHSKHLLVFLSLNGNPNNLFYFLNLAKPLTRAKF